MVRLGIAEVGVIESTVDSLAGTLLVSSVDRATTKRITTAAEPEPS